MLIHNPLRVRNDHYDYFRTEGRFAINIGVGLSLLNFEVYLKNNEWENKIINDKLYYINNIDDNYDYVFTYGNFNDSLAKLKTKKFILMIDNKISAKYALDFINRNNILKENVLICCGHLSVYKNLTEYDSIDINKYNIKFFPPLFPIPDYHINFKKFNFNLINNEIKVYVQLYMHNTKIIGKYHVEFIKNITIILKESNYDVKLYIQTNKESIDTIKNMLIYNDMKKELKNIVFVEPHISYDKIYYYLDMCNIGIIFNSPCSQYEFISLGKPVIIIIPNCAKNIEEDIKYPKTLPLFDYENKKYIFESDTGNYDSLKKYIINLTSNPKESYDQFKKHINYSEFSTWKNIMNDIFKDF